MNNSTHDSEPARPAQETATHVAIIMDGNGRWARSRGLPRVIGHRKGAEAVRRVVEVAPELGIQFLTLYSFSSENWGRPESEVGELMQLLRHYLRSEIVDLHKSNVRLRIIGERERLAPDIVRLIENGENLTRDNTGLTLVVALSYGGRQELTRAMRALAAEVSAGRYRPEEIEEKDVARYLMTEGIPDPDLVIRTSGEKRLSNFLLWQSAYAELVFVDTLWPDFGRQHLEAALCEYQKRERRYGASVGSG
jgi:undecaprenyl diphosphate synthase